MGIITDNRALTEANAAPASATALVKIRNEKTNIKARAAPKPNVINEYFVFGVITKRIRQIREATK